MNTVVDSPTMFSRRLVEILACGGIAVTNNTCAVDNLFKDHCYPISCGSEFVELFYKLKTDFGTKEITRLKDTANYIAENHTWLHRLQKIVTVLDL